MESSTGPVRNQKDKCTVYKWGWMHMSSRQPTHCGVNTGVAVTAGACAGLHVGVSVGVEVGPSGQAWSQEFRGKLSEAWGIRASDVWHVPWHAVLRRLYMPPAHRRTCRGRVCPGALCPPSTHPSLLCTD